MTISLKLTGKTSYELWLCRNVRRLSRACSCVKRACPPDDFCDEEATTGGATSDGLLAEVECVVRGVAKGDSLKAVFRVGDLVEDISTRN